MTAAVAKAMAETETIAGTSTLMTTMVTDPRTGSTVIAKVMVLPQNGVMSLTLNLIKIKA